MDAINEKIQDAYLESILKVKNKKIDEKVVVDKQGMKQLDSIVKKIVMDKIKKHGDIKKAKEQALSTLNIASKNIIDGYIKKAMSMGEDVSEAMKLMFRGFHMKDNILDDITVEEFYDTLMHNIPKEKLNKNLAMKEFENLIKSKLDDGRFTARKIIPDMIEELSKEK